MTAGNFEDETDSCVSIFYPNDAWNRHRIRPDNTQQIVWEIGIGQTDLSDKAYSPV